MPGKKVLHLTLERDPFDRIAKGRKRNEYREYKRYWKTRLEGREYDVIVFRNGYASDAPKMWVEFRGLRRDGKARKARYIIRLGKVLKIKHWRPKE